MKPYTDINLFEKKYMELSPGQSEEYFELRNSMLTQKYRLQDMGITLFSMAMMVGLIFKLGHNSFKSPRSKLGFILLAIFLPLLSVLAHVFDLIQALDRQEFPHWADSIGIALMGLPIQLVILLVWSLGHLFLLKGVQITACTISLSLLHSFWLGGLSILTALLITLNAFYGQYWYALPSILWLYFYLSLAAIQYKKQQA